MQMTATGVVPAGDRFGEQRLAQHGKLWKTNILGGPTVMVYSEEDIRRVIAQGGLRGRAGGVTWGMGGQRGRTFAR